MAGEPGRKRREARNEVASSVNSWSQGHKVADAVCVHKRSAWWNPPTPKHNAKKRYTYTAKKIQLKNGIPLNYNEPVIPWKKTKGK